MEKIVIIGGGNLGTSLAKGLILSEQFSKENLLIAEKRVSRATWLKENGFNVTSDNIEAVKWADTIVLSVKPQQFDELAKDLKSVLNDNKIIISTITGVSHASIAEKLGKIPTVRVIPNTALEILESMTCVSFSEDVDKTEKDTILGIFDKLGKTMVVPEDLMGAATVVGACGTAFALRFMRAMAQGGIEIGFNSEISHFITAQTVKGAAQLILSTKNHPEHEIDKVTTPQGITISGLNEMEHQGFSSAVIRGLLNSYNKLSNIK
jgi:pyrroline-5-carboxylate reductase